MLISPRWLSLFGAMLCGALASHAVAAPFTIEVSAGEHARKDTPVKMRVDLSVEDAQQTLAKLTGSDGKSFWGQITKPCLLQGMKTPSQKLIICELHFILPELAAGKSAQYRVEIGGKPEGPSFAWHDTEGQYNELHYGDKPVLRYMYKAFDDSTPENRFLTYKVFHHLFDQAGERIVTNGPDGHSEYTFKGILFPHHRGIFYGFNKCTYEGGKADVWHCQGDDYQGHAGFLSSDAGPILGRHVVGIDWHGKGKQVFATEQREITVYQYPTGRLIEFASIVTPKVKGLNVDGDPQHAGFQFRAHNEVAAVTKGQTYYLRVDGKGKEGETRNWPDDKTQIDFPWKGVSFVLSEKRYTCAYLDKPTNPKPARYSERDYARFGSYFATAIMEEQPLQVNYRLWFQDGEMTGEQIAALSTDFVDPPTVKWVDVKE